ncbi:hypothetical protein HNQ93_000120 [Hymenobacter luteus]|uniref:Uncharacterized protein n=2 Tax=Hymenobacter TaxID=89966 RepID=A0A7W9WAG0_9BACT|nr:MULTISPECIES: hypothetical protein [Hymenobacter]MBB4600400.1 hypothetical protein [Hymenobacter latericoloratus]MBB6057290.1 hypothetical protein [Hymenobacter luteus]
MLPPEERRLQTLERILRAPEAFPPTAWLCAPPNATRWEPETTAAVLLTAVAGQPVPAPPGLVRTMFMDEVQLLMERLLRQVPGATPSLRVSILSRYKDHHEFPALTGQPETLAFYLADAVKAGGLSAPEALAHFQRYFSHFTLEAAKHIMAKAFLGSR